MKRTLKAILPALVIGAVLTPPRWSGHCSSAHSKCIYYKCSYVGWYDNCDFKWVDHYWE